MKIITFYLPQFHTFPENDMWWGKGFTEWTNTRKAKPLFKGHYQPHIPYKKNYYDLTKEGVMKTQIEYAKKYGIYGFCFYHYWFTNGKKLMEKPVETFLEDKTLNIKFCLSWANEHWTKKWDGGSKEIIMEQNYGSKEDWKMHFEYLLPFFKDSRYIYEKGKPMLIIYRPELIPCFDQMMSYWKELAQHNGLEGLFIMAQGTKYCVKNSIKKRSNYIDGYIMYEPGYTYSFMNPANFKEFISNLWRYRSLAVEYIPRIVKLKFLELFNCEIKKPCNIVYFSTIWKCILKHNIPDQYYPGGFANWDNTARRNNYARIIRNSSPELFEKFFTEQIKRAKYNYRKEYLFFTACNEWAEGSHLEPDEKYGFKYLQAVKRALQVTGEFEQN